MSLQSLGELTSQFGFKKNSAASGPDLYQVLKELHGISFDLVTGFAGGSSVAVTGIAKNDTIVAGFYFGGTAANHGMLTTASLSIPTAGKVKVADTSTANKKLLVIWFDKS